LGNAGLFGFGDVVGDDAVELPACVLEFDVAGAELAAGKRARGFFGEEFEGVAK